MPEQRKRRSTRSLLVAASLVLAMACSSNGPASRATAPGEDVGPATTTIPPDGPAAQVSEPGTEAAGGRTPPSSIAENAPPPGGSTSTTAPSRPGEAHGPSDGFPLAVELASPCLHPGERQEITVRTRPMVAVVVYTAYAGGPDHASPDYPGGNNGGVTDRSGRWSETWVVGAQAPPGRATVYVRAESFDDKAEASAAFTVADASARCGDAG